LRPSLLLPASLLFCVLVPGSARAQQEDAPLSPPPLVVAAEEAPADTAPRARFLEDAPPAPSGPAVHPAARITLEALGGAVGGAGLGMLGAMGGCLLASVGDTSGGWACLGGILMGGVLGVGGGIPLGGSLTGMLLGAHGSPLLSVLGTLAGGVAGILLGSTNSALASQGFLLAALPLAGGVLGYELGGLGGPAPLASSGGGLRLQPRVALSPDGRSGALGLGGVF